MSARRRSSAPAVVISALAVLVSLTGTGVAAVSALPRNSVGTVQLRTNAVVAAKVRNGSLLLVDVKSGLAVDGPVGPRGPQGQSGPSGPVGAKGDRGGHPAVVSQPIACATVPAFSGGHTGSYVSRDCPPTCPPGSVPISAGAAWDSEADDQELWVSSIRPLVDSSGAVTGFRVRGGNDSGSGRALRAFIQCFAP